MKNAIPAVLAACALVLVLPPVYHVTGEMSYGWEFAGGALPAPAAVTHANPTWSTYLGGAASDNGWAIAIDSTGNAWITGFTDSSDFPAPGGGQTPPGGGDAFVARVTPFGELASVTYLGGTLYDDGDGIAIDSTGNVWITGYTESDDLPTIDPIQDTKVASYTAYVARISPAGALEWSSYLGGNSAEYGDGIAVDSTGNAWVVGGTSSSDFPTPGGFATALAGDFDVFVARIAPSGYLAWASFLGGAGEDDGYDIKIDATGNAWVAGDTTSANFPTKGAFQETLSGTADCFVAEITPAGTLLCSSYFGGDDVDRCAALAVDSTGNAWVTGASYSSDLPTPGGFQTANAGSGDAFVARITPYGTLDWATYLGGAGGYDAGDGIAIDASGAVWIAGYTFSSSFPTRGAFQASLKGNTDAFLARISPSGALSWSTYLGGTGDWDAAKAIAVDSTGAAWVAGDTSSGDFPTCDPFQADPGGSGDVFVARLAPALIIAAASPSEGVVGAAYSLTLSATGGIEPYSWTVASGSLPGGLSLGAASGAITGTPGEYGTFSFTVQVADSQTAPYTDAKALSITIDPAPLSISTTSLAHATAHAGYSQTLHAAGGVPPYSWGIAAGSLPSGLSLAASGAITGTPTVHGVFNFTVGVADSQTTPATDTKALSISVSPQPLIISTTFLPHAVVHVAYSQTLSAAGGVPPYSWGIAAGSLPSGLSLSAASGAISGTPTATGTTSITFRVTDSQTLPASATKTLAVVVDAYPDAQGPIVSGLVSTPSQVVATVNNSIVISATASDVSRGNSRIAGAEYYIGSDPGAGAGTAMAAHDGAFDSATEDIAATINTSSWTSAHTIYVRARDDTGNWGSTASVTVHVITDTTAPGAVTDLSIARPSSFTKVTGDAWQTAGSLVRETQTKTLSFGGSVLIRAVSLTPATSTLCFPKEFTISTSADGLNWTAVATQKGFKGASSVNLWFIEPIPCAHVRFEAMPEFNSRDRRYYVNVGEAAAYKFADDTVNASWTAPADDGYSASSGAASQYKLAFSPDPITPLNFGSAAQITLPAGSAAPGSAETASFSIGGIGRVYVALKTADEIPNWSALSNVVSAEPTPDLLRSLLPGDEETASSEFATEFSCSADEGVTVTKIAFSDRPDFPSPAARNADGSISSTRRYSLAGRTTWRATKTQALTLKRLAGDGGLYWRFEGTSSSYALIMGRTRLLLFATGEISNLQVSGAHTLEGDEGIWPVKATKPLFTWTDATIGMKSFYVDVSTDESMPLRNRRKSVTLAGRTAGSTCQATAGGWNRVRRLAAASGGVLYWRVRAVDKNRALIRTSAPVKLVIDGGTWAGGQISSLSAGSSVAWTHDGDGITRYGVQFSTNSDFAGGSKTTLVLPANPPGTLSKTFTTGDITRLKALAKRNGSATTLYYRLCGYDADKAFVTYNSGHSIAAP